MEKIENEEDEKSVVLSDKLYADFESAAIPIAADGGIVPGYGLETPSVPPARSTENFVCLRGPCRHYWHLVTDVEMENPDSNWKEGGLVDPITGKTLSKPRQHWHSCLVNPGMETSLNGDSVYECSKWDPCVPSELVNINLRRSAYFKAHPEPEEEVPDGNQPDDAAQS